MFTKYYIAHSKVKYAITVPYKYKDAWVGTLIDVEERANLIVLNKIVTQCIIQSILQYYTVKNRMLSNTPQFAVHSVGCYYNTDRDDGC